MRIAIVSDIHSNHTALETVLHEIDTVDQIWNLGDTIGYGPRPNECLSILPRCDVIIAGNHDLACIGRLDLEDFNADARTANLWNGLQLTPENRAALERLPSYAEVDDGFIVAHGSPREPVWEYLLSVGQAADNFEYFTQQVCFVGHSHVPLVFTEYPNGSCTGPMLPQDGEVLELAPDFRYFVNPGSIGQPRNHDPRAAFALLDTDAGTVTFRRVTYDISKTQRQMEQAGLPLPLIRRLAHGM